MRDIQINDLKQIDTPGGPIYHIIKSSNSFFQGFGEAYFSSVQHAYSKAWKKHTKMTCNLVVPCGKVRFVIYTQDKETSKYIFNKEIELGPENYKILTIPPGYIFGFMGISEGLNLVLNVSDIIHSPEESIKIPKEDIDYDWKI